MINKQFPIISPHKNRSREVSVLSEDIERVYKDSELMVQLLNRPHGMYNVSYAIAHAQVEQEDPLRFFVVNPQSDYFKEWRSIVIINPVIVRRTRHLTFDMEGCLSYAKMPMQTIGRFHKIEVEYKTLEFDEQRNPKISSLKKMSLSGKLARIWQHETDHLNAKYIYE